jgi:hypothetical protein
MKIEEGSIMLGWVKVFLVEEVLVVGIGLLLVVF